ncbi:MAG TPA: type II toxin-antitoxin system RelE/ParE family toxin [Verrucomicrobiae bacterium]|jgi:toxin ParE1/3/4|nr:type II toxin-antitoxin system RelE/ParE family toxin [Verrucomicrobiae bacterium]
MSEFRVSATAREDLEEIWIYIAVDNSEAADRLIHRLVSQFRLLASMPGMGWQRDDLASGLRSFPLGNYVIFYRSQANGIEIVRVLHRARDFPPLFD